MLKAVEKNDGEFMRFCNRDVFGTRIKAYYSCYSTDFDFVRFWAQYDDSGTMTAAIGRIDGDATLCAHNADIDEIKEFLGIVGFRTLQCEAASAEKLCEKFERGYVLRCDSIPKYEKKETKKSFELKEIYDIIKPENADAEDYLPWLSDTTYRMNRNAAGGRIAVCDGKNAGCAMIIFRTDAAAVIGAVSTKPEYRCRGIARSLVLSLAEDEMKQGRRAELLCRDTLVSFYESMGFTVINEWGMINNEAELL